MSSLARIESDPAATADAPEGPDYIPLIMRAMDARGMGIRAMALKANIRKSRLGTILHRDHSKRSPMTLPEFQAILRALDIDLMQAIISVEMASDTDVFLDERFATLAGMLSTMFKGLPQKLAEAVEELDGMDGSEIRKEWGTYFQSAVIKRMVSEIGSILKRRAQFGDHENFGF